MPTKPRRLTYLRLSLLVIPLLLFSSSGILADAGAPPKLPAGGTTTSFVLVQGSVKPILIDTYSKTNVVQYSTGSNASVTVSLMTSQSFQSFQASKSGIASHSIFYKNGTRDQESLSVAPGSYDLVLYAYAAKANVTITYQIYPNNPLVSGPLPAPEPTGIASFGLANQSGTVSPYSVSSSDVIGAAEISALQAYNATAERNFQVPNSAISLQFNANLVVEESNGNSQVYWLQNTPVFVTATSQIQPADNIWNSTTADSYLNANDITSEGGRGSVFTSDDNGTTDYYYDYEGDNSTYSLPMGLVLLENSTVEPGQGVVIQFGQRVIDPGAPANQARADWFDNATIHDSNVQRAYFLTSGNATEPGGRFYDTELVFAGDVSSEATNFTAMDSRLGIYYMNGTSSHSVTAFPSYFSFGWDTVESADDLRVTYTQNDEAQLSVGTPNYDYLGAASGSFSLQAIESQFGMPGAGSGSSSTSNPAPEFPPGLVPFLLIGTLVVVALLVRHPKTKRGLRLQPFASRPLGAGRCLHRPWLFVGLFLHLSLRLRR